MTTPLDRLTRAGPRVKINISPNAIPQGYPGAQPMVTKGEIQTAVDKAKELMKSCGIDVDTTTEDLIAWFDTEIPFPDITLGEVIINPFLVAHELVEIDEMLKMGFELTKDVIMKNPEEVDDAHLRAAEIEMKIAHITGAAKHIKERIKDIERWCVDKTLAESRKASYRQLLTTAKEYLADLEHSQRR